MSGEVWEVWGAYHERERLCPEGVRVREIAHVHYGVPHMCVYLEVHVHLMGSGFNVGVLARNLMRSGFAREMRRDFPKYF